MLTFIKKIIFSSIKTKKLKQKNSLKNSDETILQIGEALSHQIAKRFKRALAIRFVDAGSCNACELEVHAVNNPYYNLERFNIHFVASPRHADLLLVTGPVTRNMKESLQKTYEAMPFPKLVIALGDCAHCGGVFKNSDAIIGAVNKVIPVNYVITGCPPSPIAIMQGILKAVSIKT